MNDQFRARLNAGELLVGTMITLGSPEVAEIMAAAGFDWLFIDAEHGAFGTREMQVLLQAAGSNTPCVIRLSSGDEVPVKKALDIGAAGIIAPQINTAEDARRVVQLAKYAPTGTRGVGIARAHQYGAGFQEYVEAANDNLAVIVQAEHVEAVRNIESIVRVEGVDAVLIGPYDLSASLGKPGQVRDPEVTSAIDHVTRVCQNAGLRLGIFGISAEAVKPYVERGYTLVVVGVDTMMLVQGAGKIVSDFKG